MSITLRGMTWSHPRGYDPLIACTRQWAETRGVSIDWSKRSLQDFESFPVETLAREYDLIVLDHPHMGQIVREACLASYEEMLGEAFVNGRQADYCGDSYESYRMDGRLWALPIDAACQIQAYRDDDGSGPARSWAEVMERAAQGRVMCPLKPPHALMAFFTLAANAGFACGAGKGRDLIDIPATRAIYELLLDLSRRIPRECFEMDPIDVYEVMAAAQSRIGTAPLIFGYVNYGWQGFRPTRLRFADIPSFPGGSVTGSVLGGTGLAISAFSKYREEAAAFADWVSGEAVQKGLYAAAGGQPAHLAAWQNDVVDQTANGFYRQTLRTIQGAWTRPRIDGFMRVQDPGSLRLSQGLLGGEPAEQVLGDINAMYREEVH